MNRLKKFLTDTADSLLRVALRYPVETALCIYACIFGAIQIEWSFDYHMLLAADGAATEMRQLPDGIFTMLPLTMLATLVVHTLVGRASRAWRTLYLLVPLLLTIASWLLGKEWFGTSQFFIISRRSDCSWPAAPCPTDRSYDKRWDTFALRSSAGSSR